MTAFVLAGNPRVAGNLLCRELRALGCGQPGEYARRAVRDWYVEAWGIDPACYWPTLWERRSAGGVFGVKVHWHDREYEATFADFDELVPPGAHWVMLRRRDVEAQARSWLRALDTGRWSGCSPAEPYHVDGDRLEDWVRIIEHVNAGWEAWFAARGIVAREVWFEDVIAAPVEMARELAEWIRG